MDESFSGSMGRAEENPPLSPRMKTASGGLEGGQGDQITDKENLPCTREEKARPQRTGPVRGPAVGPGDTPGATREDTPEDTRQDTPEDTPEDTRRTATAMTA